MVNTVIVNSEHCVVGQQILCCGRSNTHHTVDKLTKHKGACRVTCVLAGLRAHYTTPAIQDKEKKKGEGGE